MNDLKVIKQALNKIEVPTEIPTKLKDNKELWNEMIYFPYNDSAVSIVGYPTAKPVPPTPPTPLHEYVDLGLSVLWATCNIGATKPEEYGNYYAWGELETKESYSEDNYTYIDNPEVLPASHDVATQLWGDGWRMPTKNEIDELIGLGSDWVEVNGVNCRIFSGPDQKSIILPAAGGQDEGGLCDAGEYGYYWSSSQKEEDAWSIDFSSDEIHINGYVRYYGGSVRPVKSK